VYFASLLLPSYRSPRPALSTGLRARGFLFVDLAGAAHEFDKRLNLSLAASPANL